MSGLWPPTGSHPLHFLRRSEGGVAPYILGGALLILLGVMLFGMTDVSRALQARSRANTALRAAVRAAATAGELTPDGLIWDADLAQGRFNDALRLNMGLDSQGQPPPDMGLIGPFDVHLQLLNPGDPDPISGEPVYTPTAIATLQARLPLLALSRFTNGPVPLRAVARCHLSIIQGQLRISDD